MIAWGGQVGWQDESLLTFFIFPLIMGGPPYFSPPHRVSSFLYLSWSVSPIIGPSSLYTRNYQTIETESTSERGRLRIDRFFVLLILGNRLQEGFEQKRM